jgi:hypothetical protein
VSCYNNLKIIHFHCPFNDHVDVFIKTLHIIILVHTIALISWYRFAQQAIFPP